MCDWHGRQYKRSSPAASEIKTFVFCFLFLFASIRHYFPKRGAPIGNSQGREHKPRLASPRHRNSTSARIAGGSPHWLSLWLGPSIIVGCRDHCETTRHGLLFGRMSTARHLTWPSFTEVTLRRWSWRIPRRRFPLITVRQLTYLCLWI